MNWIITEFHNMPLILCGLFYSVLCIFSLVTGLLYASGKRKLNPIELSDEVVKKLSKENKVNKFAIKMGWVTFFVGIAQGLTSFAILRGYNVFFNLFAICFTVFSTCSVLYKLKRKKNVFSFIKLFFYVIILIILLLAGVHNYRATDEMKSYLKSSKNIHILKIKEGYFFDGVGNDKAIIFFPGARVQYTAYSKLMYNFAINGYDCFLLSVPLNLAFFGANTPDKIIGKYNYDKWYISGHSLGGVVASLYGTNHPENIFGIINLASYPTKKIPSKIHYVSFYGDEDKVLDLDKFESSKKYLPDNYQIYIINGGNHSGFANYGEQKGDGKSKVSSDEQQNYVIAQMLN